jgi:hypothetical protein
MEIYRDGRILETANRFDHSNNVNYEDYLTTSAPRFTEDAVKLMSSVQRKTLDLCTNPNEDPKERQKREEMEKKEKAEELANACTVKVMVSKKGEDDKPIVTCIFKALITQRVLMCIERFRIELSQNFTEKTTREIVLHVDGVTTKACEDYFNILRWQKNGFVGDIPQPIDPACLILAHYFMDDRIAEGGICIKKPFPLTWQEISSEEGEDGEDFPNKLDIPIELKIDVPSGWFTCNDLALYISSKMNDSLREHVSLKNEASKLHRGTYKIWFELLQTVPNTYVMRARRMGGIQYNLNMSTDGCYFTHIRPKLGFTVSEDFPAHYPEGLAERVCTEFIESLCNQRIPWYVKLEEFALQKPIAKLILANQSFDLVTWISVPSASKIKVSSYKTVEELLEYARAMKKRFGYVDDQQISQYLNDAQIAIWYQEIDNLYAQIKATIHPYTKSSYLYPAAKKNIYSRIDDLYIKISARIKIISNKPNQLQRTNPYNFNIYKK